jgi:hypothetical protein
MTKPKPKMGNPLGDSNVSAKEAAAWVEAAHFSRLLKESADRMFDYYHGKGGGPEAYSAVERALRILRAEAEALARRDARRKTVGS